VVRLLQENKASKQIVQLIRLAELAGYQIEFSLKRREQPRIARFWGLVVSDGS
jgi:hypothetical protein